MKHVMIDIETMGLPPKGAIMSIGAVFFDPKTGQVSDDDCLHIGLTLQGNLDAGRVIDPDTVEWWCRQDAEAGKTMTDKIGRCAFLDTFIQRLRLFLDTRCPAEELIVWAKPPSFDILMLEDAMKSCGAAVPWKHWNVRDVRTIVEVSRWMGLKDLQPPEGAHDPIVDCLHQIELVSRVAKHSEQ